MIVKDEAHIIHESLSCTLPLIDTYCIVDTGSTDDTIAKIREFYADKGIQGEIHERPWVDFGTNRSQALELCNGKMDYILVIDADDLMTFPENGRQQLETILAMEKPNGLQIHIHQTTIKYWRTQIFKADDGWRYVGVLHEYPTNGSPTVKIPKLPETFWMESRRLGGRTRAGNKAERDIAVLEKGLEVEPTNERYMFYLAQSYRDAGKYDKACEMYKKRFRAGGWAEESWYAAYRVGDCYRQLGNIPKFEYWMQKAYALRPWRAEPLYQLVEHFRKTNGFHKAYHYLQMGRKREKRNDDVLFVETFPNDGGFEYEATILDYYVKSDKLIGLRDSVTYLLAHREHDTNVISNLKFYVTPIPATFHPLKIPSPFGPDFRPSAISVLEYPLANIRFVNYQIRPNGSYKTPAGIVETNNAYIDLSTGEAVCVFPPTKTPLETTIRGLEDLRLYRDSEGVLRFTCTNYHGYVKDTISIVSGRYDVDACEHRDVTPIASPTKSRCEKNWVHIPGTSNFLYSWHPLRIGHLDGTEFRITQTHSTPPFFSHFRGSAQPFRVGEFWWTLVHFVEYSTPRKYYHCFIETTPDFKPTRVSLPFVFKTAAIEYCITAHRVHDTIVCYPSFNDSNPEECRFLMKDLSWVNCT